MTDGFHEFRRIDSNIIYPPGCKRWGYDTGLRIHNFGLQPLNIRSADVADALGTDLIDASSYSVIARYLRGSEINPILSNIATYVDNLLLSRGKVWRAGELTHGHVDTILDRRIPAALDDARYQTGNGSTVEVSDDGGGNFQSSATR